MVAINRADDNGALLGSIVFSPLSQPLLIGYYYDF